MVQFNWKTLAGGAVLFGALWFALAPAQDAEGEAAAPPTIPAAPREIGPVEFDGAIEAAGELPRLHSLLVLWRDDLVVEEYFNGARPQGLANIKSASKSVLSALVGIAIEKGHIESVHQPIAAYFPNQLQSASDARKREITIEDLLTMRSGLESTSNRNYGAWVMSRNWVQHALTRTLRYDPGTSMDYSTGNTHLLSAILTRATGRNTWQFAQEEFAKPLGFSLPRWPQDPQGIYFGGNDMLMTPRQLLEFGMLYLRRGQRNGQQVVSAQWVDDSLTPRTDSPRERGRQYGYGWWMRDMAGYRVPYAWGYGGQFVFIVPNLDLVVVTTSDSGVSTERRGHLRTIYDVVEEFIVQPVSAAMFTLPGAARAASPQGIRTSATAPESPAAPFR